MNRRDFLRLRTEAAVRVAEVSCERLYMHYQQAQVAAMPAGVTVPEQGESEPPTEWTVRPTEQWFGEVERKLQGADVVRLVEPEWLVAGDYRRDVERVLAAFRSRGGRVEGSEPVDGETP
jgi:hypothetical protein